MQTYNLPSYQIEIDNDLQIGPANHNELRRKS